VLIVIAILAYLFLPYAWDSDRDGVDNSQDAFPNNPNEWRDSDGDGIGDNQDIYDLGEGAILIRVTSLSVVEDCDDLPWIEASEKPCDPFFVITIDAKGDGTRDCEWTTGQWPNQNVLLNPSYAYIKCSVDDDTHAISFNLHVRDSDGTFPDTEPYQVIDYTPGDGSYEGYVVHSPFSKTVVEIGDGSDGYAAEITWVIEVVED